VLATFEWGTTMQYWKYNTDWRWGSAFSVAGDGVKRPGNATISAAHYQ